MPETKEVVIPSLSFDAFKDQLYRITVSLYWVVNAAC